MQITIDEVEQYIISKNSAHAKNGNSSKTAEAEKKFSEANFQPFLPLKKSINELTKSLTSEARKIAPANPDEKKMQEEIMKCIQSELKSRSSKISKIFQDREAQKNSACAQARNYALLGVSANSLRQKKSISEEDFRGLLGIFQNGEGSCSLILPAGEESKAFFIALKSSGISSVFVSFSDSAFADSMKSLGESIGKLNHIEKIVVPQLQKVSMQLTNNPDLAKEEREKLEAQRQGLELEVATLNDLRDIVRAPALTYDSIELPVAAEPAPSQASPSESESPRQPQPASIASSPSIPEASVPSAVPAETPSVSVASETPATPSAPVEALSLPEPVSVPAAVPEPAQTNEAKEEKLPEQAPAIAAPMQETAIPAPALPEIAASPASAISAQSAAPVPIPEAAKPAQLQRDFTALLNTVKAEHSKSLDADLSLLYRGLAELDSIKNSEGESISEALLWRDKLKYEFKSMPAPTATEAKVLGKLSDWSVSAEGKKFASGGSVPTIMRLICFRKDSKKIESRIVLSADSSHPFKFYESSQEALQKNPLGIFDIPSYESSFSLAVLATQVYDEDSKLFLHPALYSRDAVEPKNAASIGELEDAVKSFTSAQSQSRLEIALSSADSAVSVHQLLKNSGAEFAFSIPAQSEAHWRALAASGKIIDIKQKLEGAVPESSRHLGYSYANSSEESEIAEEIEETAAIA